MDATASVDDQQMIALFIGPVEVVIPSIEDRYLLKPNGNADQGHKDEND